MEKLTKEILNELNEWDLSCSEESTLKLELAKALTKVVKNCNLHAVVGQSEQLLAFAQYLHNHSYINKGFKPETLVRRFKGE